MSRQGATYARTRGARVAAALLSATAVALAVSPSASATLSHSAYRAENACTVPRPGTAGCLGIRLVSSSLTGADLKSDAVKQASEVAQGVSPAVSNKSPLGGYGPEELHAAYSLPSSTFPSSAQTVAIVDAFNDPTAEADLGVYDKQYGLPACTTSNGCFRKLDEEGKTSPLPTNEGGWATEISLDVQMVHAICQSCHIMLVEAASTSFTDLGAAVDRAVELGATEVSNSYGGAEFSEYASLSNAYYRHPGVAVTVSTGDCGYFNQACGGTAAANFPADSPDVVAVGGTTLTGTGESWSSAAWNHGGSGCSHVFSAQLWQTTIADFTATDCASGRSAADISAIGNPETGVDVYDGTPAGKGDPTGWGVWGGTSASSPIIAGEFGLAGGAHGVSYPAATLYAHAGEEGDLYDVVSGSNGSCSGRTICSAAVGYDGPTGVGSPLGLGAFASGGQPVNETPPSIAGIAEQGQTLTVTQGSWSNGPTTISDQWEDCNSGGGACAPILGATGPTYELGSGDVGSTIRVQETAVNGSGSGSPAVSAQTAQVTSDALTFTSFTPASGITGSSVTLDGSGLGDTTAVRFGTLAAQFTVLSPAQIEAIVPNGAKAGKILVATEAGTVTSKAKFTPTLSLESFSPRSGPAGKLVKLKGIGFTSSSSVSFDGVPAASVTFNSSTKLTVAVPAGAGAGPITVTNTTAPLGTVSSAAGFSPS